MDKLSMLLRNPAVRTALHAANPQLALGVDVALSLIQGLRTRKPGVEQLIAVIDDKLEGTLKELANNPPFFYKRELEIRAHQLLEIIMEWDKIN